MTKPLDHCSTCKMRLLPYSFLPQGGFDVSCPVGEIHSRFRPKDFEGLVVKSDMKH
jgi:hypothetical protein